MLDVKQLSHNLPSFIDSDKGVTIISTYFDNVSSSDLDSMTMLLDHGIAVHRNSLDLLDQVLHDRDLGNHADHNYRYYYNDVQLMDAHNISPVDMTSRVEKRFDQDGIEAIYYYSDLPLSPSAVTAN